MKLYDMYLSDIFNSQDYRKKGVSVRNIESFLTREDDQCYLVVIMEMSDFSGSRQKYEYALYSITSAKYIERESDWFKTKTAGFPSLTDIQESGGTMSFSERRRLQSLFYDILETIGAGGNFSEISIREYQQYLIDTKKMKSPSLQIIYEYFKKEAEEIVI